MNDHLIIVHIVVVIVRSLYIFNCNNINNIHCNLDKALNMAGTSMNLGFNCVRIGVFVTFLKLFNNCNA